MAHVFKKPLIPLIIMIILLALYFTRWDKEVTIKPNQAAQSIYKTDRWTGQRWVITYKSNEVWEEPTLDNNTVSVYAESVKQRPDIIDKRENMTIKAHELANRSDYDKSLLYAWETKEMFLGRALRVVDQEINRISIDTAKTDLGNKAWVKRKYFFWAWDGLFVLSSLWLLVSILLKNKKAGAVAP